MLKEKLHEEIKEINLKEIDIGIDIDQILESKKNILKIKRIFDILFSSIGILCCLPFFLIISVAIKISSKGPVFFRQIRVGKNEKEFEILKFRTMIVDAEKKGMQITVGRDSRITKIGHILRKTKLDELPQLINVFKGDMSLVGPRPEVPKYVKYYTTEQKKILKIKPGITELASIKYRDENIILEKVEDPENEYINNIMQKKIKINIEYIKKVSLKEDIFLILKTIKIMGD